MIESIVFFFKPLVLLLGLISGIVFLTRVMVRDSRLKKALFESLEQELKEKAMEIGKSENLFLCDVMADFSISLKYKNVKEIADENELNRLFKQYLMDHEEYKNKIGVLFDSELHIKLFELKSDIDEFASISPIRIMKRKKLYRIIVKQIDALLVRPQDLAKMKLNKILHVFRKGKYMQANEEINNLYQLAISTFPEKEIKKV